MILPLVHNAPSHTNNIISLAEEYQFEKFFKLYYGKLCAFAFSYTKDKDDAEEVVQQLFTELWSSRQTVQMERIQSYLYSSVRNKCLNQIKHERIKQQHAMYVINSSEEASGGMQKLEVKELQKKINEAIESLPDQCKLVFKMNRIEGMRYGEIALATNLSPKTVENHIGRALKILRTNLKDFMILIMIYKLYM
ncbi:MAG: RNA polymerase sigma-70 factor [Bacteroidetes bacterium]|nr:RNA polymerase sigma-70 factor [Bacteroidota bacterium]